MPTVVPLLNMVSSVVLSLFTQTSNEIFVLELKATSCATSILSLVPSKSNTPPLVDDKKLAPDIVPSLLLLVKSFQFVPLPVYEELSDASKCNFKDVSSTIVPVLVLFNGK